MDSQAKRRYNRVPFFETCQLKMAGKTLPESDKEFQAIDVGAGGFSIKSDQPFPDGEEVIARFGNDEIGMVEELGTVAHCNPDQDGSFFVGIHFKKAAEIAEKS